MVAKAMILMCVLFYTNMVSSMNNSQLELLPELIEQFCPYSTVCPEKITSAGTEEWSCCTGCSCAEDCEMNNNCCFPVERSNAEGKETGKLLKKTQSCLRPSTTEANDHSTPSYSMVSDVPGHDGASCGEISVAVWGSLYPVYSRMKNTIYKNTACADADDVTDGEPWEAFMTCELYDMENLVQANVFSAFETQSFPTYCWVDFEYPGDITDLEQHRCYKDVIDTCPNIDFTLPINLGLNVSKEIIRQACSSGLFAPFPATDLYANVFCYVCHGHYFEQNMRCYSKDMHRGSEDNFVGLIDLNVMPATQNIRSTDSKNIPNVCTKDGNINITCRTLHCPAGKLRTRGDCELLFSSWYTKPIGLHLSLTSSVALNITEVLPPSNKALGEVKTLKSPWPSSWKLFHLDYDQQTEERTTSFAVSLLYNGPVTSSRRIINTVMTNMNKPWLLSSGSPSNNHILQSTFSKYLSGSVRQSHVEITNATTTLTTWSYTVYKDISHRRLPQFYMNKLYICDQVELESSEFELHASNSVLYNKIVHRYLMSGEFSIIVGKDDFRARVCLEDSGFVLSTGGAGNEAIPYPMIALYTFVIIALFF